MNNKEKSSDNESTESVFRKLIEKENCPVFKELKEFLENQMTDIEAFDELISKEMSCVDERNEFINPDGKNVEMFPKDSLKGQKILIVMLWTNEMNRKENQYVNPKYISENPGESSECVASCLVHYGIEYKIVMNYKDAIIEMTNQTNPGKCDYYAVWVLNGPQYAILPPVGNKESEGAYLVDQFIDCLIIFWNQGGSVVLWNDGSGLCYQTNLFLERVKFRTNEGLVSTELRLEDSQKKEHAGGSTMKGNGTRLLSSNCSFNKENPNTKSFYRHSISHNLGKIFEGVTITYVKDESKIYPFTPFSRDSEGGINALFYPMSSLDGPGNIVIDCAYTKLFMNMEKDGTSRYVQNIAAWTANYELVLRMGKETRPCDWRPMAVTFAINEGKKWNEFKKLIIDDVKDKNEMKTIFAIDNSGSVIGNDLYHEECRKIINEFYKEGDRIFIWGTELYEVNYEEMMSLIANRESKCEGTDSSLIAEVLERMENNEHEHLVIVTDGLVDLEYIDKSDQRMKANEIQVKYVTSYVIGDKSDLNTSVGIPYCRSCPYEAYKIKSDSVYPIVAVRTEDQEKFNNMPNVDNYQQFMSHFQAFSVVIYSRTVGKNIDNEILNGLEEMRQRIEASGGYDKNEFEKMYNSLYSMANGGIRSINDIAADFIK